MRILPLVAGLLFASALVRGAGFAGAQTATVPPEDGMAAPALGADADWPEAMLAAFRAREERLIDRETQIEDRMQALLLAEREITEKLASLAAAEASLSALLVTAETAAEADLTQLTSVYESMKAANAAAIFAQMDPNLAAGFLGLMQPEAAAAVMAGLDPGAAYEISALLAGRHAGVPTE